MIAWCVPMQRFRGRWCPMLPLRP
ncbi:hypothetical protein, partial [Streptomonospora arabica]